MATATKRRLFLTGIAPECPCFAQVVSQLTLVAAFCWHSWSDILSVKVPVKVPVDPAGTPLQNDLTELKTLLSFLEPEVFGAAGERLDELEVHTLREFPQTDA